MKRPCLVALTLLATLAPGQIVAAPSSPTPPLHGLVEGEEEVVLSSPVDDLVAETPVKEGESVKAGQAVIKLRDQEQQLEARRAESVLKKAEFDARASRDLLKQNIVAADKALEQETRFELAKLESETAQLKAAERTITSPIAGVVTRVHKKLGESVGRLEPLVEVVSIDRVIVLLNLPEASRVLLHPGKGALVHVPGSGKSEPHEGRISFIDPVIDPGSGLFRVKVMVDNPDGLLRPGMRATVEWKAGTDQESSGDKAKDSSNR